MPTTDVRDVLSRLSRGEITAEQADAELAAAETDESKQRPGTAKAVTVRASMSGSGHLLVVGATIERPEARGPASVSVEGEESGAFTVRGQYADGTELTVPADADLQLKVNGGSVTLTNLRGTLHGDFNVGDVTIAGRFDRGSSTIRANAGPVTVALVDGSDVRVKLRAASQSTVDPSITCTRAGEWTVGEGRATLTIQGNLGELILRDAKHE